MVVLFDVLGTLVKEPWREIPAFFGMTTGELLKAKHPTSWVEFERGEIDEATFFARFFQDGRPFDHGAFRAKMVAIYTWLDGMEALVAELKSQGVVMHALSNYPDWYQLIEAKLGLSRYLSWSFVSCTTGVRKPDEEAFRGAARALGKPPSELLFIDDRPVNCAAARAVGLAAIEFRDAASLRAELLARGVLRGP